MDRTRTQWREAETDKVYLNGHEHYLVLVDRRGILPNPCYLGRPGYALYKIKRVSTYMRNKPCYE